MGPWKRVLASRVFFEHQFPAPHIESVIDYRVPPEHHPLPPSTATSSWNAGDVSARCHDEQANFLALNLMHDIVTTKMGPFTATTAGSVALAYDRGVPARPVR